ncbi:conjugal transfer protein TraL, partial [Cutibacterium acnes]
LGLTLCGVWLVIRPRSALSVDHWITRVCLLYVR